MLVDSPELMQVLAEAEDIAQSVGHQLTSAHLLLAVFTIPNRAQHLLKERGVDENRVLEALTRVPSERPATVDELLRKTREIAQGCGAEASDAGHLLIAMTRMRACVGLELLLKCGVDVGALRNTALSYYLRSSMPRGYRAASFDPGALSLASSAPTPMATSPAPQKRPEAVLSLDPAPADSAVGASPERADPGRVQSRPLPRETTSPSAASPALAGLELDPEQFPWLSSLGRNLSALAAADKLDPVIGRDREIETIVDILGKRRTNNPCLVGEPGVGKTAVVEGVARRLLSYPGERRIVVELDMASLVAGTQLRGSFSEKMNGLKDEMRRANGRVIAFIDEIHTLVGAGATAEGPQDAANELKSALARGEFPCIGATTHDEFRQHIAQDSALERRFTRVAIDEPTVEATRALLSGIVDRYERHHGVRFAPAALDAAATLSARHVPDRFLPDKAISLLDLAGSRARREGRGTVEAADIARQVSQLAGLPVERLLLQDSSRLLTLEAELGRRVIGQAHAVERVAQVVRRGFAGFASRRPMGSFLFLGPSGVGKTELARALAESLFGTEDALVRLDMSECSEPHGASRLIGAPPGYVGHGEAGLLTEPVRRRPSSVVLFDEIEKAHRDVTMLLLQIMDEGRLSDSRGRPVDFSNAVVILTSNLGAEAFAKGSAPVGFGAGAGPSSSASRALELARGRMPTEVWNRLDERLVFEPLSSEQLARVACLLLDDSTRRLQAEKRIAFSVDETVIEALLSACGADPTSGARPMRQTIQRLVEAPLADAILRGEIAPGARVRLGMAGGRLAFHGA